MKKREEGFTLIEILVAIAIMGILIAMISPILNITTQSNMKEKVINEIDSSLAKSVELIKRTARSAKTTGTKVAIKVEGNRKITMNVPIDSSTGTGVTDAAIIFEYNSTNQAITAQTGGTIDVIASNIVNAEFNYVGNKVLTMYIKVDLNGKNVPEAKKEKWKIKEIRDAAVTRLDVE